jgi:hypothetical protein
LFGLWGFDLGKGIDEFAAAAFNTGGGGGSVCLCDLGLALSPVLTAVRTASPMTLTKLLSLIGVPSMFTLASPSSRLPKTGADAVLLDAAAFNAGAGAGVKVEK